MSQPFISEGFVFNLDQDLRPLYRLNPFTTAHAALLKHDVTVETIDDKLLSRFQGRPFIYTENGRQAIRLALESLKLGSGDCVTILTSTGNYYISGCVTSEISKICQWSRSIEHNTKALFVNHEFGFPYPDLVALQKYGLPIIEDCCYSFNSFNPENQMGCVGDYILYSFAKYFPMQFGGLLVGSNNRNLPVSTLDSVTIAHVKKYLNHYYSQTDSIAAVRKANHFSLVQSLTPLGLMPRFDFSTGGIPGVFMFVAPSHWNLLLLKDFMWSCGVHCSVFYGEQAFFIPVHQGLEGKALDYFVACLKVFIQQQGN